MGGNAFDYVSANDNPFIHTFHVFLLRGKLYCVGVAQKKKYACHTEEAVLRKTLAPLPGSIMSFYSFLYSFVPDLIQAGTLTCALTAPRPPAPRLTHTTSEVRNKKIKDFRSVISACLSYLR